MSAKHHKILKVPLWFMASYSHSHSHRNISKAAMGRPHPACICSSCGGYFTCLKYLYVWLTSCLCVCLWIDPPLSVCLCVHLSGCGWANFSPGTWLITHSRAKATTTLPVQDDATLRFVRCSPPTPPRPLCSTLRWSLWHPQWWCKCERVCVRANACGWHNNKMLVFYISI